MSVFQYILYIFFHLFLSHLNLLIHVDRFRVWPRLSFEHNHFSSCSHSHTYHTLACSYPNSSLTLSLFFSPSSPRSQQLDHSTGRPVLFLHIYTYNPPSCFSLIVTFHLDDGAIYKYMYIYINIHMCIGISNKSSGLPFSCFNPSLLTDHSARAYLRFALGLRSSFIHPLDYNDELMRNYVSAAPPQSRLRSVLSLTPWYSFILFSLACTFISILYIYTISQALTFLLLMYMPTTTVLSLALSLCLSRPSCAIFAPLIRTSNLFPLPVHFL